MLWFSNVRQRSLLLTAQWHDVRGYSSAYWKVDGHLADVIDDSFRRGVLITELEPAPSDCGLVSRLERSESNNGVFTGDKLLGDEIVATRNAAMIALSRSSWDNACTC